VNEFYTVVGAVLPVFCLALVGVILRKVDWLTEEADASLMRVVVNLLTPAFILDKVLGNKALHHPENLLLPPIAGFCGVALGVWVSGLAARRLRLGSESVVRTFGASTGIQNYGYFALPLVEQLFPGQTTGVLLVHNLGVDAAMWSVCLIALGHAGWKQWRKLINAPIIAVIVAASLNLMGGDAWIPKFTTVTAHMLGACCFPLGIVLTGAILADSSKELRQDPGWRTIGWSCLFRLGLIPLGMLAIAWALPASRELKQVLVVQAAMPAAVFPIVMSRLFAGDPPTAIRVVIGTSLVGFVTIPIWLHFGMHWLGLG